MNWTIRCEQQHLIRIKFRAFRLDLNLLYIIRKLKVFKIKRIRVFAANNHAYYIRTQLGTTSVLSIVNVLRHNLIGRHPRSRREPPSERIWSFVATLRGMKPDAKFIRITRNERPGHICTTLLVNL